MNYADFVSRMRRRVGWFVALGLGFVLAVLLFVAGHAGVFAKKLTLFVMPPSAASFYIGQPVTFQGFTIGEVSDIELIEKGRVRVSLRVLDRYRNVLFRGSKARLFKEGLFGDATVEIKAPEEGEAVTGTYANGDTLPYETAASIEQLLLDLKPAIANANVAMKQLAEIAKWMGDPNGDVRQSFAYMRKFGQQMDEANLKQMLQDLAKSVAQIRVVADEMAKNKVAEHLAASLEKTNVILGNIEPLTRSLGKEGPDTLVHFHRLLEQVEKLSQSLEVVAVDLAELTPELPGLARESRQTIEQMRGLLEGLRGSWLFGGGAAAPEEKGAQVVQPMVDTAP